MDRRRFLISAGGLTVGLPFLRKFARATPPNENVVAPKRIITVAYSMGTHLPMYAPASFGTEFTLPFITEPLEPFKDRLALVTNCPNAVLDLGGNTYVYGHPAKKESVFTGTLMESAFSGNGGNHIDNVFESNPSDQTQTPNNESFDHFIGQGLIDGGHGRPSIDLGIRGPGGAFTNVPSNFFYEGPSNPVTLNCHPGNAFGTIFNGVNPDEEPNPEWLALQRRKKSVLDSVRGGFSDLRQGLSPSDRATLDDHADKIRTIELGMPPALSCTIPDAPPENDNAYDDMSMMESGEIMNLLMAHAMGCGLAPVGRIEFTSQQNPNFGIPLVDDAISTVQDWHHPIVHAADGWTKDSEPRVTGFRFFVQKFADLLAYLDGIEEDADGRTLLDNSILVLGSDLGEGDGHSSRDLCFAIAGGSGPGRRGVHVDGSGYTVNDVLTTLVAQSCVPLPEYGEFGLEGFGAGVIPELMA